MATLTEAQLQHMRSLGMNYAEIGKTVGLSREMVRRYADRYQVGNQCVQCKAPVPPRNRYCPKCREQHKREQAKSYHRPCFKTYDNRSIVREAYDYFQGRGCDVVMDAESGRNGPELWVDGSGVKCNRIVPVSRGFQVLTGVGEGILVHRLHCLTQCASRIRRFYPCSICKVIIQGKESAYHLLIPAVHFGQGFNTA